MKEINQCISFFNEVSKNKLLNKNSKETISDIKREFKKLCLSIDMKFGDSKNSNFESLKRISFLSLNLFCNRTKSNLQDTINSGIEIMKRKNSDYAGDSDFFKNFRNSELFGITSNERGFLVRISDKISRIETLIGDDKEKENKVQDEKVEDTLKDLSNYCGLLYSYISCKENDNSQILSVYGKDGVFEVLVVDSLGKIKILEDYDLDSNNYVGVYKLLIDFIDKNNIGKIIFEGEELEDTIKMIKNSTKQIEEIEKIEKEMKDNSEDFQRRVLNFYKGYKENSKELFSKESNYRTLETIANYLLTK